MVRHRDVAVGRLSEFQNTGLVARPERDTPGDRAAVQGDPSGPASRAAVLSAGIHPVPVRVPARVPAGRENNDDDNARLAVSPRCRPRGGTGPHADACPIHAASRGVLRVLDTA